MKLNYSPARWETRLAFALSAAYGLSQPTLFAASITQLGIFWANAISADGSTVVGSGARWNSGTITDLGDLPGGGSQTVGLGVSGDGSTVVGYSATGAGFYGVSPFIWNNNSITQLPNSNDLISAQAISADGSTVVGYGWGGGFRTAGGVNEMITSNGYALGVSGNGSIVVGMSNNQAFLWSDGTLTGLGDLPGGGTSSRANAVSVNGSTVVGWGTSASGQEAFRWNGGTIAGLGDLPGGTFDSEAKGVSGTGNTVVGQSNSANGDEAFVWTQTGGMRSLVSLLLAAGIDPATDGWSDLRDATGVSADGRYVVGYGSRNGITSASFLVDLGTVEVPEASTWAALAAVSLAGLWQVRRCQHHCRNC